MFFVLGYVQYYSLEKIKNIYESRHLFLTFLPYVFLLSCYFFRRNSFSRFWFTFRCNFTASLCNAFPLYTRIILVEIETTTDSETRN